MFKIDCNLIYERIKKNKESLDFGNQGLFWKIFCDFVICMFFCFLNNTKNETIGARK